MSKIRNLQTGLFLTGSSDGLVTISSLDFQNWNIDKLANSNFLLKNLGNERYLETNNVGEVSTKTFTGNKFQLWYYQDQSIYNLATGKCIDTNILNKVFCSYSNNSTSQKWSIE